MMTRIQCSMVIVACALLSSCVPQTDGPQTLIHDSKAALKLAGKHEFSLQWISWDDFGVATVTKERGMWRIVGRQDSQENDDFMTIDGVITEIDTHEFKFEGTIVTRIHHIAGGEAVTRTGPKTFRMTRGRPYWRMMEMNNPEDGVVDYIDVFVRRPR